MEQPAGLVSKFRQAINIYHACNDYKQCGSKAGGMAKWRSEHETEWNIISDINRLRAEHGR